MVFNIADMAKKALLRKSSSPAFGASKSHILVLNKAH